MILWQWSVHTEIAECEETEWHDIKVLEEIFTILLGKKACVLESF